MEEYGGERWKLCWRGTAVAFFFLKKKKKRIIEFICCGIYWTLNMILNVPKKRKGCANVNFCFELFGNFFVVVVLFSCSDVVVVDSKYALKWKWKVNFFWCWCFLYSTNFNGGNVKDQCNETKGQGAIALALASTPASTLIGGRWWHGIKCQRVSREGFEKF